MPDGGAALVFRHNSIWLRYLLTMKCLAVRHINVRLFGGFLGLAVVSQLHAQGLGLPALPTSVADYVGYAVTNLPAHFDGPATRDNTPAENPITNGGATLGRVLFYDRRLSHNNSTACASCHVQSHGFGDPEQFSQGTGGQTSRHSMALGNGKFYQRGRFFWDERAATLEEQVLLPIQDPIELGLDLQTATAKLTATNYYGQLFQAAFGSPDITSDRISKALAQFLRSMASYTSKFDSAFDGGGTPNFEAVLTPQENRGRLHFQSAGCAICHQTTAQVIDTPRNNGLDAVTVDPGAGNARFKVPSLRNVGVRGRYMHDGRFSTLEQVLQFYSNGIQDHPALDPFLRAPNGQPRQFNFSPGEIADLAAFLRTLTDDNFLQNPMFADPFKLNCDFSGNGFCAVDDLNQMLALGPLAIGIPVDDMTTQFDLNADGMIDRQDVDQWLLVAAISNGFVESYLRGDANLDGVVDGQDFITWNTFKFQATTNWSSGDFDADGLVAGQDFIDWNSNKFQSIARLPSPGTAIPELCGAASWLWIACLLTWHVRRVVDF